jgi:Mn-dependent DtxR family transcriptional regulator
MSSLNEADLYNLYASSNSSSGKIEDLRRMIIELEIKHLRYEHEMSIRDIAKRLKVKMNLVSAVLEETA